MSDPSITYLLPSKSTQTYVVKAEEPTDRNMALNPKTVRWITILIAEIVNLDKPAGPTSHEVSSWVKRFFIFPALGTEAHWIPK